MTSRIYIGNLSHRVREKDVERFFRGYGRVREILLKYGYGFAVSCTFIYTILHFSDSAAWALEYTLADSPATSGNVMWRNFSKVMGGYVSSC
jgi:RNA recognition motif-containing protein